MEALKMLGPVFKNYNKIRLFEAFAGIGSQAKALKRLQQKLNFDLELIGFSEIDKFAIKSYKAIHGDIKNFGDIKNIKGLDLPEIDLFTYSFPCQDISNVGKKSGFEKGSNTRSGLLWEVERILNELKNNNKLPKVLLMENVKALINKKFFNNFQEWLNELNKLGYNNYWKVINAKDHNIPQNRERIFMISILGDNNYIFPQKEILNNNLINVLENMPGDKFYLSNNLLNFFINNSKLNKIKGNGFRFKPHDLTVSKIAYTVTTRAGNRMDDNFIIDNTNNKIRKLTPLECWRLMGFDDQDFYKAKNEGISNTQLYKQAGNSIVVNVLEKIIENLFI